MGDDLGTGIQNQNLIGDDVADEINAALGDQMSGAVTPPTVVKPTHSSPPITADSNPPAAPEPPAGQHQPEPAHDDQAAEPPAEEPAQDSHPAPEPPLVPEPESPQSEQPPDLDVPAEQRGSGNTSELFDIKQQALQQLSPLVGHLDQSPEERFDTILMMLRASDDPTLVQACFDAAQDIVDDKKRAQALLDVVNEVNYLTRPQNPQE